MKMIGPHQKSGRKMDPLKKLLLREFGKSGKMLEFPEIREQIYRCKDNAARRLLLGKSEKVSA